MAEDKNAQQGSSQSAQGGTVKAEVKAEVKAGPDKDTAAKAAPAKDTRSDDQAKRDAEVGALRSRVAELEDQQRRERRTSDATAGEDYDPRVAMAELWPAQRSGTRSD